MPSHHGDQRERDDSGDGDGKRHSDGELPKQSPDYAAHEQEGNQGRDERDADRYDRETDLTRGLVGCPERWFALPHTAADRFHHHDSVVDNKDRKSTRLNSSHSSISYAV